MEFVEAPPFTRHLPEYLSEDGYKDLQSRLGANPELGDLMPGTGGFRKLRWADARRGKGRRGGLRIIYYYFQSDHQILVDGSLQQERGFRPDSAAEKSIEACDGNGIGGTRSEATRPAARITGNR